MDMEDFVSFKMANKLKEKGFRFGKTEIYGKFDSDGLFHSQLYFNYIETMDCDEIIAPTISQVLKWLRDEKKIHICIDIYDDGWFFDIASFYKEDTGVYEIKLPYKSSKVTPDYDSFEQAALAGIEYSLDNLI